MAPKFNAESFSFAEDEMIPEHINEYPSDDELDPAKWHLIVHLVAVDVLDDYDVEAYQAAINIDNEEVARLLFQAWWRRQHILEQQHPGITGGWLREQACMRPPRRPLF